MHDPRRSLAEGAGVAYHPDMLKAFLGLALANVLLLLATAALGLAAESLGVTRHVALAIFTLLLSVLVQVLTFTYFTVTGKMIGQAVHIGGLSSQYLQTVKKLKKRVTRCLGVSVVSLILVTGSGADLWSGGDAASGVLGPHVLWGFAATAVLVLALFFEFGLIAENSGFFDGVMREYANIKAERSPRAGASSAESNDTHMPQHSAPGTAAE